MAPRWRVWSWRDPIGRVAFATTGLGFFLAKHGLDRIVASRGFSRSWDLLSYWFPRPEGGSVTTLSSEDRLFFAALVALALPFIWIGVGLTLRRLRTVGGPAWLTVLFFLPFVNVVFFVVLIALPERGTAGTSVRAHATEGRALGSAATAVLVTSALGVLLALLAASVFGAYGYGVFVALPFALGMVASLLYARGEPVGLYELFGVALLSILVLGTALVAFALEGAICLLLAAPLAVPLALLGAAVGRVGRRWNSGGAAPVAFVLLIALPPGVMTAEHMAEIPAPVYTVVSTVDVAAPPEAVWNTVIAFPDLPAPTEWMFRLGIAYPMSARIEGEGRGALRFCVFSTGAFVEPIEIWMPPARLRFSVSESPPPLRELNPFANVHPPHLDGFLVARAGEFRLERLSGNRTRLIGTTDYQHHLWPAAYWRWWSDWIIHRIHLRVLHHVKGVAETRPG